MGNLLFTGASGFLGENIKPLLQKGYCISTMGLSEENDYSIDLAKNIPVINKKFDVILHAAGKAHTVPTTEYEKQLFFDVNFGGTKNLCVALERSYLPDAIVFISTVAVYGSEKGENITENYPLNGNSPYAMSKKQAESFLIEWCKVHNVKLSILRPSLIAGERAPGNLEAMINGIRKGWYLNIGGGSARKSVLMVQDIARLIPLVIAKEGIYNVCDDSQPSFKELGVLIARQLGKKAPVNIPFWLAKCLAMTGDIFGDKSPINSLKLAKLTETLTFSNEKAKRELDWEPLNVLENFKIK